jgi:hypothetical protein
MLKRKQLIWIGSVTLALLLITGYALSQPPSAPGAAGRPGAPGGPPGAPAAGGAGAPGAAGATDSSAAAALSQSTPEQQKSGLDAVLAMIATGKVEGRLSTPCTPGQACATYGGVKTPSPVAVWAPPIMGAGPELPTVYVPDPQEAKTMLRYYGLRYQNVPNAWAERQKDFDLQTAGELDNQTKGQKPYPDAVAPPITPPSSAAPASAPSAGATPGGPPAGMPGPGATPPGGPPGTPTPPA